MRRIRQVVSITLLLLLAVNCTKSQEDGGSTERSASTYERIVREGRIRVGYISYPPSFIHNPNTNQFSGIYHEVLAEIGRRAGLKIEYTEEVAWGTMIEALRTNKVDLICTGLWPNIERGKHVNFTEPLYYSVIRTYTRSGNNSLDGNLAKLDAPQSRIAAIDGEMTSVIANADFPKATLSSLPQTTDISQVLLDVATGKAEATFAEPAVAEAFMASNPGKIKEVSGVKPVRVFPNTMAVGKSDYALLLTLNIALEELHNNGFIEKVLARYEKSPNSFYRVAVPYRQ
jgi:polar amino acid transport system substrate-binding protein